MEPLPKLSFVCPMPWQDMTGDERRKFCTQCGHHVQNLSLLARKERLALLERAKTERICGAYFIRLSGEMVTPDQPLTPQERKGIKQLTATALSAGVLALAAGCTTPPDRSASDHRPAASAMTKSGESAGQPTIEPKDEDQVVLLAMGIIVCEPPKPPKNAPPSKRF